MKFRRKPEIVDAFLWTGSLEEIENLEWVVDAIKQNKIYLINGFMRITGLNDVSIGDYVVLNKHDKIYSTTKNRFEAFYEPVD